jgi:hypothetical protein
VGVGAKKAWIFQKEKNLPLQEPGGGGFFAAFFKKAKPQEGSGKNPRPAFMGNGKGLRIFSFPRKMVV